MQRRVATLAALLLAGLTASIGAPASADTIVGIAPMISIVDLGQGGGSQNYGGDPSNCGWIGGKYLNCP